MQELKLGFRRAHLLCQRSGSAARLVGRASGGLRGGLPVGARRRERRHELGHARVPGVRLLLRGRLSGGERCLGGAARLFELGDPTCSQTCSTLVTGGLPVGAGAPWHAEPPCPHRAAACMCC